MMMNVLELIRRSSWVSSSLKFTSSNPLLFHLTKLISIEIRVEDGHGLLLVRRLHSVVLDHAVVNAHVVALDRYRCLGRLGIDHKVVVAVRAVLIGLLKLLSVLAEALFALLACECHVEFLQQRVVLGFFVAFNAVEPFFAWKKDGLVGAMGEAGCGVEADGGGVQHGERIET
jgi:hypothetical protein